MPEYYIVEFKKGNNSYYCLWFSKGREEFFKQNESFVLFNKLDLLKDFTKRNGLIFNDECTTYDIGFFENWQQNNTSDISCKQFLDFWNITSDIAYTLNTKFYGDEDGIVLDVYNNLFYGNNLPAIRGDGEIYVPTWDREDIDILSKVIRNAINILQEAITLWVNFAK